MDAEEKEKLEAQTFTFTAADWRTEAIEDHLNCCLCGTALRLKHKADFIMQSIEEEAFCPTCGIRNRKSVHSLQ